jgi:hypothetical protein
MGPTPEELVEEDESANKGLIDKASDTVKNGLATVTNAVNSIGSKLGLVKEPAANTTSPNNQSSAAANNKPANNKPANNKPANNQSAVPVAPSEEPDSEGENMVDLSDYEVPTSEDEGEMDKTGNSTNTASEDDLDSAIDQLNKASTEALSSGKTNNSPVAATSKPQTANSFKPRNQSTIAPAPVQKPVNTANALVKASPVVQPPATAAVQPPAVQPPAVQPPAVMTGGAADSAFFKTFKKLLAKNRRQKTKKK